MRSLRIISGILLWLGLFVGAGYAVHSHLDQTEELRQVIPDLVEYAKSDCVNSRLTFDEALPLKVGDPILRVDDAGHYTQIGEVSLVREVTDNKIVELGRTISAEATLYGKRSESLQISELEYFYTPNSLDWVMITMLSEKKQQQLVAVIQKAVLENQSVIMEQMQPVIRRSMQDALEVLEEDLVASLQKRQRELAAIGARYQNEVLQKELVPLVKTEIMPIVQANMEPTARDIGLALWERLSIWRFTWRYLYDVSPLPEKNKFSKEWDRFVKQEAIPEIEGRTDEIIGVIQDTMKEVARNKKVKRAVRASAKRVMNDTEIHAIVWRVFRDVIVDNERLHKAVEDSWKTPEAKYALKITGAKLQPYVTDIGRLLFGTPEDGVTPEFASVLRNRILQKDKRWLVVNSTAEPDGDNTIFVKRGPAKVHNPFAEAAAIRDIKRGKRVGAAKKAAKGK